MCGADCAQQILSSFLMFGLAMSSTVLAQELTADEIDRLAERAMEAFQNPSLTLGSYVGTYRDPWHGDVFVEAGENGLMMRFGRSDLLTGPLEHFQYDAFIARWRDRSLHGDAYSTFILGADGEVESIRMKMLSPDTDFSFDFHHLDLRRVAED
jgi:hypothetical protein